jgi:hypothetical protein
MWGLLPELDAALCGHVNAQICCFVLFKIFGIVRCYDDESVFCYLFIMLIKFCYLLLC